MIPLRAFLLLRDSAGTWDVQVFRDLEGIVAAWERRSDPNACGVVHVGFTRSAASQFDSMAATFSGRVLLSASARFAFPKSFMSVPDSIGEVDGVPFYLAATGWGYDATDYIVAPPPKTVEYRDWLVPFVEQFPSFGPELSATGVYDDKSYELLEGRLGADLRTRLGIFRVEREIGPDSDDPCAFARASPPWLKNTEFRSLDISVRVANVFSTLGVVSVGDLGGLTLAVLLRTQNFGRKSARDLLALLDDTLRAGPVIENALARAESTPLLSALRQTLLSYPEREREVLALRMGLDVPSQTLAEIGEKYGVTRERIRQIEARAMEKLIRTEVWDDLFSEKLRKLLKGRNFPLPLLGVEAIDPWFAGVAEHFSAVQFLLDHITDSQVSLVTVDGIAYLALISSEQWDATVTKAKRLLASGIDKGWTEEHCIVLVEGLLPATATEFQGLLWEKASEKCVFVSADGQKVLRSYGRGAEHIIEAILEESDTPLHYSEIAERAQERAGRTIDVRRAHNAAADVGLQFAPGSYGSKKHLRVAESDLALLAEVAEDVIADGENDRQWHCGELLELLRERLPNQKIDEVDKYHLNIGLKARGTLKNYGRMVWAQPTLATNTARIEIREAAIATLEAAGRPLRTDEIRQRLCAMRGMGQYFQLNSIDPLIRIGQSLWALNDRDCVIKRSAQPKLCDDLEVVLEAKGNGIHITEVLEALSGQYVASPNEIFALATLDDRLRVSVGQYLYLQSWGEPRRQTTLAAVRSMLNEAPGPLLFDEIFALAQRRVGRHVTRNMISGALHSMSARLVGVSSWMAPSADSDDADDDLDDDLPQALSA